MSLISTTQIVVHEGETLRNIKCSKDTQWIEVSQAVYGTENADQRSNRPVGNAFGTSKTAAKCYLHCPSFCHLVLPIQFCTQLYLEKTSRPTRKKTPWALLPVWFPPASNATSVNICPICVRGRTCAHYRPIRRTSSQKRVLIQVLSARRNWRSVFNIRRNSVFIGRWKELVFSWPTHVRKSEDSLAG